MPLNPSAATSTLLALGQYSDASAAANAWADVFVAHFREMIIPPVAPSAVSAAKEAITSVLAAGFSSGNGPAAIQAAGDAFAAIIAAQAIGGIATPAVGLSYPSLPPQTPKAAFASAVGAAIYAWSLTGTFTVAPAPPVPWS